MKNGNKIKEWGLSHPVICRDLLRSLCLILGWDLCPAPCPQLSMFKCFCIGSQGGNPTTRGLFIGSSPLFITKTGIFRFHLRQKKKKKKNSKSHDLQPHGESETDLNRRLRTKKKRREKTEVSGIAVCYAARRMQHKSHTASHIQLVYMIISRVSGPPLPRGSSRRRHRAPSLATLAAKFGPKSTKPQLGLQTSPEQAQNKPCQHN